MMHKKRSLDQFESDEALCQGTDQKPKTKRPCSREASPQHGLNHSFELKTKSSGVEHYQQAVPKQEHISESRAATPPLVSPLAALDDAVRDCGSTALQAALDDTLRDCGSAVPQAALGDTLRDCGTTALQAGPEALPQPAIKRASSTTSQRSSRSISIKSTSPRPKPLAEEVDPKYQPQTEVPSRRNSGVSLEEASVADGDQSPTSEALRVGHWTEYGTWPQSFLKAAATMPPKRKPTTEEGTSDPKSRTSSAVRRIGQEMKKNGIDIVSLKTCDAAELDLAHAYLTEDTTEEPFVQFTAEAIDRIHKHVLNTNEADLAKYFATWMIPPVIWLRATATSDSVYEWLHDESDALWTGAWTMGSKIPKPDYLVGLSKDAWTLSETDKLDDIFGTWFSERSLMFPFLICEYKAAELLDTAHVQNMHSCAVAVNSIVALYQKASLKANEDLIKEIDGKILIFSVFLNAKTLEIRGHYAKRIPSDAEDEEERIRFRFVAIVSFDFNNLEPFNEETRKKVWSFVKRLYNDFAPIHRERIKRALAYLPAIPVPAPYKPGLSVANGLPLYHDGSSVMTEDTQRALLADQASVTGSTLEAQQYEDTIKGLREQIGQMQQAQQQALDQSREMQQQMRDQTQQMQQMHKDRDDALDKQFARLTDEYKAQMEKQSVDYKDQMAKQSADYRSQMEKQSADYKAQMDKQSAQMERQSIDYKAQLKEQSAEHKAELARQRTDNSTQLENMASRYELQIANLTNMFATRPLTPPQRAVPPPDLKMMDRTENFTVESDSLEDRNFLDSMYFQEDFQGSIGGN